MNTLVKTNLIVVLLLVTAIFSFNAIAQTEIADKPMEAKALSALIVNLKEVVSENARTENDAKLIAKKWDARKDLSGKTKSDVIELLYEDVKTVIKDSGVRYGIYSVFTFYQTIPDKSTSENASSVEKIRLKNPTTIKGTIGGESHDSYVIRVRKNQTLSVQISWEKDGENKAEFIVSRSADFFAGDVIRGISTYNEKNWYTKIKKTGDYYVYVTGHPVATYTLKVSVK